MFSRIMTRKSTSDCSQFIDKLQAAISEADVIIIGAGAGLSTSAGFVYAGERFDKHFSDFSEKYGFHDMYTGGFYPYQTLEEHWAYWSRYIFVNRYMDAPKPVYQQLFELVINKNYFVLTTNVDHCFQKAGFDKQRLFYTQGDYGLFQCSEPCCQETFDNEAVIRQMMEEQADMAIPSDLLPVCPHCGKPMTMNLRSDNRFVEDVGWHGAARRYEMFLQKNKNGKVLFLELGTGYNTPGIIKYPFWQMTNTWKNATYACINLDEAVAPAEIEKRSICINEDIGNVLEKIAKKK
jgi:NAD-dependent protein deacetylases, SIR2 family